MGLHPSPQLADLVVESLIGCIDSRLLLRCVSTVELRLAFLFFTASLEILHLVLEERGTEFDRLSMLSRGIELVVVRSGFKRVSSLVEGSVIGSIV